MHSQRSGFAARSPPPLQHPIPTHPKVPVPGSPVRADYAHDEQNPYTPQAQNHYAPQTRAPPAKRGGYQRISSPRGTTPVNAYAPQQRNQYTPQNRGGATPQHRAAATAAASAYAPPQPSRSNSTASVVPNMNMYQSTTAPYFDGASTPDAYPNAYATPQQDYAKDDAWGFGGQAPLGGGMMNDATAQMGMQFGRHVAQVGGEYMQKNVRIFAHAVPQPPADADAQALL